MTREIFVGEKGLSHSWQNEFPEETKCAYCKGKSRIGFVYFEDGSTERKRKQSVCRLHDNDPDGDGYWLHDCCAVAVYFCRKCLKPTALYNQA